MPDQALLFKRTALAAAIAACFPGLVHAAGAARVDFSVGNVAAVGKDGRVRALARGSEIEAGETIDTRQGRAQLRFADGAYMSLQPDTQIKLDEYRYAGKPEGDQDDNIVMSLVKGGMRTITGLIGRVNRKNYKLVTPTATIGIRGTEYTVTYTNPLYFHLVEGEMFLLNNLGVFPISAGQTVILTSIDAEPTFVDGKPDLAPAGPDQRGQRVDEPTNPVQQSAPFSPPVTPKLTGTFAGNFARSALNFEEPASGSTTSITLDANGALSQFLDTFEGSVMRAIGTASVVPGLPAPGNDGIIAWGRWFNGTILNNNSPFTLTQPFHYIVGLPATSLPTTGSATYNMIGHSASCAGDGCTSALVNSSSLGVNFGMSTVTLSKVLTINGDLAGTRTLIQTSALSGQLISFTGGTFTPNPGLASFSGKGFLSGEGGSRAGLAWKADFCAFSCEISTNVKGVTAYAKQ